jgi:hypothetical protein
MGQTEYYVWTFEYRSAIVLMNVLILCQTDPEKPIKNPDCAGFEEGKRWQVVDLTNLRFS